MKNRLTQLTTIAATCMTLTLTLAGCSTTGVNNTANGNANNGINTAGNIGMSIFKTAIDNKCRSELSQHKAWRIARVAMSENQEAVVQDKICGCVSEQAPQQLSISDMTKATIDSEYRKKLATRVVVKSLQSCYGSFMK